MDRKRSEKSRAIAKTGKAVLFRIAVEQFFPEDRRIFTDPMALQILPRSQTWWLPLLYIAPLRELFFLWKERPASGWRSNQIARKQHVREKLVAAIHEDIEAAINIGAGFDPLLYDLGLRHGLQCWEVDQAASISQKAEILEGLNGGPLSDFHLVPVDLIQESPALPLAENGYSHQYRTFYILEGVLVYLTPEAAMRLFQFLAGAQLGSQMVFSMISRDFIEGVDIADDRRRYTNMVVDRKWWKFGMNRDETVALLTQQGWAVEEIVDGVDLDKRYVIPKRRKPSEIRRGFQVFARKQT